MTLQQHLENNREAIALEAEELVATYPERYRNNWALALRHAAEAWEEAYFDEQSDIASGDYFRE